MVSYLKHIYSYMKSVSLQAGRMTGFVVFRRKNEEKEPKSDSGALLFNT